MPLVSGCCVLWPGSCVYWLATGVWAGVVFILYYLYGNR